MVARAEACEAAGRGGVYGWMATATEAQIRARITAHDAVERRAEALVAGAHPALSLPPEADRPMASAEVLELLERSRTVGARIAANFLSTDAEAIDRLMVTHTFSAKLADAWEAALAEAGDGPSLRPLMEDSKTGGGVRLVKEVFIYAAWARALSLVGGTPSSDAEEATVATAHAYVRIQKATGADAVLAEKLEALGPPPDEAEEALASWQTQVRTLAEGLDGSGAVPVVDAEIDVVGLTRVLRTLQVKQKKGPAGIANDGLAATFWSALVALFWLTQTEAGFVCEPDLTD